MANNDGTGVKTIATNGSGGVAVDSATGRVYWGSTGGMIRSANLDGTDQQIVVQTNSSTIWSMSINGGRLFFNSSGVSGSVGVARVNLDGTGLVRIGDNSFGEGLSYDTDTSLVYYQRLSDGRIRKVDADGLTPPSSIAIQPDLGFFNVPGLFVDTVQDKIYYANGRYIHRSNLDGTGLQLVTSSAPDSVNSLFVDSPHNTIWWGSRTPGHGQIGRMNLDGSGQVTLILADPDFYALTLYEPNAFEPVPADFDNDADVDGADFLTWQRNAGMSIGANVELGDANADGKVDASDLAVWKAYFGSSQLDSSLAGRSVPEPATAGLIAALVVHPLVARARDRRAAGCVPLT